jgi:hypothetical protein
VPLRDRSFYLATGAVLYVALAASQQGGAWLGSVLALVLPPPLLAWAWRRTHAARRVQGPISLTALSCVRVCVWGGALWCAARAGPAGRPAFDVLANIGVGSAAIAACVALARLPPGGGLLAPPRSATSLDAAWFAAACWGVATALPAVRALSSWDNLLLDPLASDYATSSACLASLLLITTAAARLCVTRRLELGVTDRSQGALALALAALCISVPAAAADIAAPDRTLPVGVLGAALAAVWAATTPEPTTVTRTLRGTLAVLVLGAPTALTMSVLAKHLPAQAGPLTLFGCCVATAVGLVARRFARPFGPEQSRWLDALEQASQAALEPDPQEAIVATLRALQQIEGSARTRPELWRHDPPEVLAVDAAGYLHTSKAVLPDGLYELCALEPERTLRRDVLDALSVRRPEARSLASWLAEHDGFAVTTIVDEQEPTGFLLFPAGGRTRALTLEEARAARRLADRLSAVLGVSSALARSRQRELSASARVAELERETERLSLLAQSQGDARSLLALGLAAGVRRAAYSAAARMAIAELERLGRAGSDIALIVPQGANVLGWAAIAHVASERASRQLSLASASESALQDPDYWQDAELLREVGGGTLVLHNLGSLPTMTQDALAIRMAQRGSSEEQSVLPFALIAPLSEPLAGLLEERYITRALGQHLASGEVRIPALVERPEDLRALVLDRLDRSGARHGSEPLGIEPQALRLLVDHHWPGNELELEHVVTRAAHIARGTRVTVDDLAAAGFSVLAVSLEARPAPEPFGFEPNVPLGSARRRRRR